MFEYNYFPKKPEILKKNLKTAKFEPYLVNTRKKAIELKKISIPTQSIITACRIKATIVNQTLIQAEFFTLIVTHRRTSRIHLHQNVQAIIYFTYCIHSIARLFGNAFIQILSLLARERIIIAYGHSGKQCGLLIDHLYLTHHLKVQVLDNTQANDPKCGR